VRQGRFELQGKSGVKFPGDAVSLCDIAAMIAVMLRDMTNDTQYIPECGVWFVVVCSFLVICL
jgi:hypothetical protein